MNHRIFLTAQLYKEQEYTEQACIIKLKSKRMWSDKAIEENVKAVYHPKPEREDHIPRPLGRPRVANVRRANQRAEERSDGRTPAQPDLPGIEQRLSTMLNHLVIKKGRC